MGVVAQLAKRPLGAIASRGSAHQRRHLNKGQQAMVTAMAYPNPEKRGGRRDRGQSSKNEDCRQISSGNLSMARFVLRNNFTPEGQRYPDRCLAIMAGMTPTYRVLTTDPTAYILSANVHRRHLNKGQQAMVTAMAYPDKEKGGRGKKSSKIEEFSVASGYVSQARYILRNNFTPENQQYPDRCLAVMAGTVANHRRSRARVGGTMISNLSEIIFQVLPRAGGRFW